MAQTYIRSFTDNERLLKEDTDRSIFTPITLKKRFEVIEQLEREGHALHTEDSFRITPDQQYANVYLLKTGAVKERYYKMVGDREFLALQLVSMSEEGLEEMVKTLQLP